jgi:hypothetical protein
MKAWLVNSNWSQQDHCFEYMIRHNKVAAYGDAKMQIKPIEEDDLVLLYHNENRIIAVGCVVKGFEPYDHQTALGDFEYWADVNWLWKAFFVRDDQNQLKPVNPIMRTDELNIPMVGKTVVNITDQLNYRLLWEEIAKRQIYM